MTMFFNRASQAHDFSADSAYRFWLISRNKAPVVYHSGDMQWKRFCIALRHVRTDVRRVFAKIHMALVADKMRRARHELARVGVRHAKIPMPPDRRRAP